MDINGPQTSKLPENYLDVMLPELAEKGLLGNDAHEQVLAVLGEEGFQRAMSTLSILMTIEMLSSTLQ